MYLVWFQRYEEAYFAVGGFRKVAPEELQDDEALVSYFLSDPFRSLGMLVSDSLTHSLTD